MNQEKAKQLLDKIQRMIDGATTEGERVSAMGRADQLRNSYGLEDYVADKDGATEMSELLYQFKGAYKAYQKQLMHSISEYYSCTGVGVYVDERKNNYGKQRDGFHLFGTDVDLQTTTRIFEAVWQQFLNDKECAELDKGEHTPFSKGWALGLAIKVQEATKTRNRKSAKEMQVLKEHGLTPADVATTALMVVEVKKEKALEKRDEKFPSLTTSNLSSTTTRKSAYTRGYKAGKSAHFGDTLSS